MWIVVGQIGSEQFEAAPLAVRYEGGADPPRRARHENAHTLLLIVTTIAHSTTTVRHMPTSSDDMADAG